MTLVADIAGSLGFADLYKYQAEPGIAFFFGHQVPLMTKTPDLVSRVTLCLHVAASDVHNMPAVHMLHLHDAQLCPDESWPGELLIDLYWST